MKQVIILKEGITGKQHQASKRLTNNKVKEENTSISFCIKQVLKHDESFLSAIAGYKKQDVTPANLLPLLQGKEGKSNKFSAWLVMTLVKRYYAVKVAGTTEVIAKSSAKTETSVVKGASKKAEKVTA
jgi:hypothetical protein